MNQTETNIELKEVKFDDVEQLTDANTPVIIGGAVCGFAICAGAACGGGCGGALCAF
jgi:hypothetical protein